MCNPKEPLIAKAKSYGPQKGPSHQTHNAPLRHVVPAFRVTLILIKEQVTRRGKRARERECDRGRKMERETPCAA